MEASDYTAHLVECGDCLTSLFQFLQVRDFVDYQAHPCFHLAYYMAPIPERCLEKTHGEYGIITEYEKRTSVVIGFYPWCGLKLLTNVIRID